VQHDGILILADYFEKLHFSNKNWGQLEVQITETRLLLELISQIDSGVLSSASDGFNVGVQPAEAATQNFYETASRKLYKSKGKPRRKPYAKQSGSGGN
jgi:hypothetical protein